MENSSLSLLASVQKYLDSVRLSRSENTARTYTNAMQSFLGSWMKDGRDPEDDLVSEITEDFIGDFAADLKSYSPNTEQLYLTAATGYFEYLAAEKLADINLPRLRMLIKRRSRRTGQRLPQFPKGDIQKVLKYAQSLSMLPAETKRKRLQHLRDRAFIITLADTGLRVHEACNLRRGDLDWQEGKAIIIGKGNQQAIVRFSTRALTALRDYINTRAEVDGAYGRSLTSLPIFARHDLGAGFNSNWRHDDYDAHYPDGWEIEWIDDPTNHDRLQAAIAKNQKELQDEQAEIGGHCRRYPKGTPEMSG